MALRARHAKQWTVEWQSEEGFTDVVNKIETALQSKKRVAVESVKAHGRAIRLTWSRSVGYGGAYAWVKEIVGELGVWRLSDAVLEEPRPAEQVDKQPVPHLMHKPWPFAQANAQEPMLIPIMFVPTWLWAKEFSGLCL